MDNIMQYDQQHKPGRKPYIKPRIETVPLLPRQTVLGTTCYSSSQTEGTFGTTCTDQNGGKCLW